MLTWTAPPVIPGAYPDVSSLVRHRLFTAVHHTEWYFVIYHPTTFRYNPTPFERYNPWRLRRLLPSAKIKLSCQTLDISLFCKPEEIKFLMNLLTIIISYIFSVYEDLHYTPDSKRT